MSFPAGPNSGTLGDWIDYTGVTVAPNYTDPTTFVKSYRLTLTATPSTAAGSGYHYVYKFSDGSGALTPASGDTGTGTTFVPGGYQTATTLDAEIACDTLEYFTVEILRVDESDNTTECSETSTFGYHCVCSVLTGGFLNVSQTSNNIDPSDVSVMLWAQTSDGYKVVSAVIDWGDGSAAQTVSPTPNAQYYTSDFVQHSYSVTGLYTATVTFKDNATPTQNTYVAQQDFCVCVLTSAQIAAREVDSEEFNREYPDPALVVEEVGSVTGTGTVADPYIRCYRVGLTQDVTNKTTIVKPMDTPYLHPLYFGSEYEGLNITISGESITYKKYISNDGGWTIGEIAQPTECETSYNVIPTPTLDENGIIEICTHTVGDDVDVFASNLFYAWFQIGAYTSDACNGFTIINNSVSDSLADYTNAFDAGCPAGQHDDGTGNCIDNTGTTGDPQTCAEGFYWTGTYCREKVGTGAQLCVSGYEWVDGACQLIHETVDCPDGQHDDGTGTCVDDATGGDPETCAAGYYWNGTACVRIPEPDACIKNIDVIANTATLLVQDYGIANLPTGATEVLLQQYNGTTGDTVKTIAAADANATFNLDVTQIDYLRFRWQFTVSGVTYTGDYVDVTTSCCEGDVAVPPAIPTAPVPVKDCANDKITFPVTIAAGVDSVEVTRDDAPTTIIGTFTAPGTFVDLDVEYGTYKYRLRAKSGTLYSEYSAWSAAVDFSSATMTLAITKPADAATLNLDSLLEFTLTDSTEPDACDPPSDSPCADDADVKVLLDGIEVDITKLKRTDGTARNGTYQLALDTRYFANGSHVLKVQALGMDCCPAGDSVNITIANTFTNNTRYTVISYRTPPPTGTQWRKTTNIMISRPLNALPQRRAWMRTAVATSDAGTPDWDTATEQEKADYFNSLQRCKMELYEPATTPDYDQLAGWVTFATRGSLVKWVMQFTPYETQSAFHTGLTDVIQFCRVGKLGDDDAQHWALATGTGAAKIYQFDGELWGEKYDLADYTATDAISFAVDANAVYVATAGGEIIAIDRDSGQATANIAPRGETRKPKILLNDGTNILWIFTDAALETAQTKCYSYVPGNLKEVWTLDAVITQAKPVTVSTVDMVLMTDGSKLYGVIGGTAGVIRDFAPSIITAIGANTDSCLVGTSTGEVYSANASAQTLLTTLGGSVNMVDAWNWTGQGTLPIAATDSNVLYEQGTSGTWASSHLIAPLSGETVDSINTVMEYEKTITAATGEVGSAGYVPAIVERKLFIGTGNNGYLVTLEMSNYLQQQGARLVSVTGRYGISPLHT